MSDFFGAERKAQDAAHERSDVDNSRDSFHHTLGPAPTQAAPGNHKHDDTYEPKGTDTGWITVSPAAGWTGSLRYRTKNGGTTYNLQVAKASWLAYEYIFPDGTIPLASRSIAEVTLSGFNASGGTADARAAYITAAGGIRACYAGTGSIWASNHAWGA